MEYLMNNGQSSVNNEIRDFCESIQDIKSIDNLKELDKFFLNIFSIILIF